MMVAIGENRNMPLYKYTSSLEYCIDMISNERVFLSRASDFNDPYDSLQAFEITEMDENDKIEYAYKSGQLLRKAIEQQKTVKIACFSEKNDSSIMWGHYANAHKGYCIEYKVSDIVHHKTDLLLPVVYDKRRIMDGDCEVPDYSDFMNQLRTIVYKEQAWSYEYEWRFIKHDTEQKKRYIENVKPRALYLGCKNEQFERNALEDIKLFCCSHGVELYKMELSNSSYKMVPKKIDLTSFHNNTNR